MSDDLGAILKAACDAVIADADLRPQTVNGKLVTHCSEGAARIAEAMGCFELSGFDADEQYQVMSTNPSGHWTTVTGREATIHALDGGLAFAALPSHILGGAHGHIAAVYPVGMQWSGSLGYDVPMVANVGKTDCEEKVSAAFPVALGEPDYYAWDPA